MSTKFHGCQTKQTTQIIRNINPFTYSVKLKLLPAPKIAKHQEITASKFVIGRLKSNMYVWIKQILVCFPQARGEIKTGDKTHMRKISLLAYTLECLLLDFRLRLQISSTDIKWKTSLRKITIYINKIKKENGL